MVCKHCETYVGPSTSGRQWKSPGIFVPCFPKVLSVIIDYLVTNLPFLFSSPFFHIPFCFKETTSLKSKKIKHKKKSEWENTSKSNLSAVLC